MKRVVEQTADGSATLYVPQLDEHYHSVKGARTESQHIFVDMGLKATSVQAPQILEVGFGTGLNALLTLEAANLLNKQVHYMGVELYPLKWSEIDALGYSKSADFEKIHAAPWGEETIIKDNFTLIKLEADINEMFCEATNNKRIDLNNRFDLIYFDAFAPEKQPEMWSQELFNALYKALRVKGILTTYCAKGVVRRMLQAAGFVVERLPGPPGGKREILRATKF